tara:strand:+ start:19910 stop:20980 length:1071 start_codon:yes stop_codon:yes gene_type:complete
MKSIKITSLTDHLTTPSSRFRVRQLLPHLKKREIEIYDLPRKFSSQMAARFIPSKRISRSLLKITYALLCEVANIIHTASRLIKAQGSDYLLISRELIDNFPSFEKFIRGKIILDIDDAIFINRPQCYRKTLNLLNKSPIVFAGNSYLYSWCKQFTKDVYEVPTAVDTHKFCEKKREPRDIFIVGWQGTSSSFHYLKEIEGQLEKFFYNKDDCQLNISSDRYPSELESLTKYIKFKQWNEEDEVKHIHKFDVGIMPIEKSEYSLGKCSYKMLLYLSCGIPACVTSWGMNKDVLEKGKVGVGVEESSGWNEALEYLYQSRNNLEKIFPDCRKVVEDHYSVEKVVDQIERVIRSHRLN